VSCCLRILGEELDVDSLVAEINIKPYKIWKKGDRRFPAGYNSNEIFCLSGITYIASDADMDDFECQLEEATEFLLEHHAAFKKIKTFLGVDQVVLDFAVQLQKAAINSDYLPPEFLGLLGELGIGLELSHFSYVDTD